MKKTLMLLTLMVMILAGCMSMGQPKETWTFQVEESYNDDLMKIQVLGLEHGGSLFAGFGVVGVDLSIQNASSKPAVIVWKKSALEFNRSSHQVFLAGQKYADAGREVPDRVIGAGSKIDIGVFPAEIVYYESGQYGGWRMRAFKTNRLSCLICVQVEGEERFYTVHVDITEVETAQ
jgi:hypothetical protein